VGREGGKKGGKERGREEERGKRIHQQWGLVQEMRGRRISSLRPACYIVKLCLKRKNINNSYDSLARSHWNLTLLSIYGKELRNASLA
jgi:hypothetical protein